MGPRTKGPSRRRGGDGGQTRKRKRGMPQTRFDANRIDDDVITDEEEDDDESEDERESVKDDSEEEEEDSGPSSSQRPSAYSLLMKAISKKSEKGGGSLPIGSGGLRSSKRLRTEDDEGHQISEAGQREESHDREHEPPADTPDNHPNGNYGGVEDDLEHGANQDSFETSVNPREGSDGEPDEPEDAELDPEREIEEEIVESREADGALGHDEQLDEHDPFQVHFAKPDEKYVAKKVEAIKASKWRTARVASKSARSVFMVPDIDGDPDAPSLPPPMAGPSSLNLKKRLRDTLVASGDSKFDEEEQLFASFLFNYKDLLYCKRTHANAPKLRKLLCLHALNHCFKTRDRILRNSDRINQGHESSNDSDFQDQGFTRPKVLFLLPTREACARTVHTIIKFLGNIGQENRKRFEESFVDKERKFTNDKPADFLDLFEGNDDDNFRIGVKLTRKNIKLYSQFYNSDILLASPLGLRLAMTGDKKKGKPADREYLSSIELVVVDQADALLMQNWEHVEHIFEYLNLMPESTSEWEISRTRPWYLENHARYYRQTIILSQFNAPDLAELQRLHCLNWAGKGRVQPEYAGEIQKIGIKLRQSFTRFDSPTVTGDPDARFKYFTATIVPMLAKKSKNTSGTLLFVPSYIDFVRVRNYFANSAAAASISFGTISEYADVREVSRAMSHFRTGRHRLLLYTERAHHFRRHVIRGAKRIIMYSVPDNPIFYREIVGFLARSEADGTLDAGKSQGLVRVCFSKYDVVKLERIVGTGRVGKMVTERGDVFDFL